MSEPLSMSMFASKEDYWRAKCEQLERDAARYQWLREPRDEQQPVVTVARQDSWGNWKDEPLWEEELDNAIDNAREVPV